MIFVIKVLQPKPRKFPFFFAFYIEYFFLMQRVDKDYNYFLTPYLLQELNLNS